MHGFETTFICCILVYVLYSQDERKVKNLFDFRDYYKVKKNRTKHNKRQQKGRKTNGKQRPREKHYIHQLWNQNIEKFITKTVHNYFFSVLVCSFAYSYFSFIWVLSIVFLFDTMHCNHVHVPSCMYVFCVDAFISYTVLIQIDTDTKTKKEPTHTYIHLEKARKKIIIHNNKINNEKYACIYSCFVPTWIEVNEDKVCLIFVWCMLFTQKIARKTQRSDESGRLI